MEQGLASTQAVARWSFPGTTDARESVRHHWISNRSPSLASNVLDTRSNALGRRGMNHEALARA